MRDIETCIEGVGRLTGWKIEDVLILDAERCIWTARATNIHPQPGDEFKGTFPIICAGTMHFPYPLLSLPAHENWCKEQSATAAQRSAC